MTKKWTDESLLEEEAEINEEKPKTHTLPPQTQTKFWPQSVARTSKFGKWGMSANPPMKQRPGRAAGRGR
jgi:hypothetical protein